MKLIGRLNRSLCDVKKEPFRTSNETSTNSKFRQSIDDSSQSSGLSFCPSKYDDDGTLGGMTVYDWSVADNAPSVGSAGKIFDDIYQPVKGPNTATNNMDQTRSFRKKVRGHCTQKLDPMCEDSDTDPSEDQVGELNIQCSMLSNSPAKTSCASVISDATPLRKGGRSWIKPNRNFLDHRSSEPKQIELDRLGQNIRAKKDTLGTNYKSIEPTDVEDCGNGSTERNRAKPRSDHMQVRSEPVDVDDYISNDCASTEISFDTKRRYPSPQLKDEVELYFQDGKTNIITPLSQPLSEKRIWKVDAETLNEPDHNINNEL